MVCFAWAGRQGSRAQTMRFSGDRESVRRQSVIHALKGILKTLDDGESRPNIRA
jgi:nicotinamide-nucleotide amidase